MEQRINELEEIVKDLEDKVWTMTNIVGMLAADALDDLNSEWGPDDKKTLKELIEKL